MHKTAVRRDTIGRMTSPLPVVCPAASTIHPPDTGTSVVCGVLENANQRREDGGGHVSPVLRADKDPSTIAGYCAGQGVPGSPASYCACVVWRAEKQRRRAGDALTDEHAARQGRTRG